MDNIKIRKATEEDREAISFVYADAFSKDWDQLSTDIRKVKSAIMNGLILENYIVATYNEKVVAFLALVIDEKRSFKINLKDFKREFGFFKGYMIGMAMKSEMENQIPLEENSAYIDIIGVCKEFQHKGIASFLIEHVFKNYNYSTYSISVTNINHNAIKCYEKKGFVEYKRETVKYAKQRGFSEYIFLKYTK